MRYEFLNMFIYTNPVNQMQRNYNVEMLQLAEAIRCQRSISITCDDIGFYDKYNLKRDFLDFFLKKAKQNNSTWEDAYKYFYRFMNGKCTIANLSVDLAQEYQEYLLNVKMANPRLKVPRKLNVNTAAKYYCIFRKILKDAYKERLLKENINDFLDYIPQKKTIKEYLTMDEVRRLYRTPCRYESLRRASMFAIFTGLRLSDIVDLNWDDIRVAPDGKPCITKTIVKTDTVATIFISEEALQFCGPRMDGWPVFPNFSRSMTKEPLRRWLKDAGIEKHITFHCFRHTNATLMSAAGVDIYTVRDQLTHAHVKTTEIYAKLVDPKKRAASEAITLKRVP